MSQADARGLAWFLGGAAAIVVVLILLAALGITEPDNDGIDDYYGVSEDCIDIWREAPYDTRGSVQDYCADYPTP